MGTIYPLNLYFFHTHGRTLISIPHSRQSCVYTQEYIFFYFFHGRSHFVQGRKDAHGRMDTGTLLTPNSRDGSTPFLSNSFSLREGFTD